jgi:hypothetical protein
MSGRDPIANIKLLEDPAKNLAVIMNDGKIFKHTLSRQRDAQEPSSIPKRKRQEIQAPFQDLARNQP